MVRLTVLVHALGAHARETNLRVFSAGRRRGPDACRPAVGARHRFVRVEESKAGLRASVGSGVHHVLQRVVVAYVLPQHGRHVVAQQERERHGALVRHVRSDHADVKPGPKRAGVLGRQAFRVGRPVEFQDGSSARVGSDAPPAHAIAIGALHRVHAVLLDALDNALASGTAHLRRREDLEVAFFVHRRAHEHLQVVEAHLGRGAARNRLCHNHRNLLQYVFRHRRVDVHVEKQFEDVGSPVFEHLHVGAGFAVVVLVASREVFGVPLAKRRRRQLGRPTGRQAEKNGVVEAGCQLLRANLLLRTLGSSFRRYQRIYGAVVRVCRNARTANRGLNCVSFVAIFEQPVPLRHAERHEQKPRAKSRAQKAQNAARTKPRAKSRAQKACCCQNQTLSNRSAVFTRSTWTRRKHLN